jgi:hypothetical protein
VNATKLQAIVDPELKNGISLQGNIADIELNTIFQFFDFANASGELRILAEENNAIFFFQKGILIFGALSRNQKKIGELLLESRHINRNQLEDCLKIHSQDRQHLRLGEIMVQKGYIRFEVLAEILQSQARDAFFATLSWKKGMFYFYANHTPSPNEILINERIDHLLLEGIVRIENSENSEDNEEHPLRN